MKRGMYWVSNDVLGECVRVGWAAGDGAPYLTREIYEILGFEPPFDTLPHREEFVRRHPSMTNDVSPVPPAN